MNATNLDLTPMLLVSRALNMVPGGNALAGMDDRINNYLNHSFEVL